MVWRFSLIILWEQWTVERFRVSSNYESAQSYVNHLSKELYPDESNFDVFSSDYLFWTNPMRRHGAAIKMYSIAAVIDQLRRINVWILSENTH